MIDFTKIDISKIKVVNTGYTALIIFGIMLLILSILFFLVDEDTWSNIVKFKKKYEVKFYFAILLILLVLYGTTTAIKYHYYYHNFKIYTNSGQEINITKEEYYKIIEMKREKAIQDIYIKD